MTRRGDTPAATPGRGWTQAATPVWGWTQAATQAATPVATPEGICATKKPCPGNYCWTHGHHVSKHHTSATCANKAPGHRDNATASNTFSGSDKDKNWNAARTRWGGMANFVYCNTNDLCQNNYYFALSTPSSCNPTNLPTSHTGMAESGASDIYFASNAPVANLNPTAPSVGVRVANGLPVRSVASAALASAPSLPPAAMQGHVMPSFPHTLIGLGPFADLGCQIVFSKHAVSVIHPDGHSILNRWREQDGPRLWCIPLKATMPILPEFDKKCTGTIGTVSEKGATKENVPVRSLPLKATRPILLEFAKKCNWYNWYSFQTGRHNGKYTSTFNSTSTSHQPAASHQAKPVCVCIVSKI